MQGVGGDGMTDAVDHASSVERAALREVQSLLTSEDWLQGKTGEDALAEIDNAEFEIDRLLSDDCGDLGRTFKNGQVYADGKRALNALRERHRMTVRIEPAVGVAVPAVRVVGAIASPLGKYEDLLPLIGDAVLQDSRNFNVLLGGLRGEAAKSDNEAAWQDAALVLYNRHTALDIGAEPPPFDVAWLNGYDRRLDARVIGHYARLSDPPGFLAYCRSVVFPDFEFKSGFTEVELRDFYLMAFVDNLVRVEGFKGTAIWYRRRWRWDEKGNILEHEVLSVVHTLYHDLLTRHEERKRALEADGGSEQEKKELAQLITKTGRSLALYGNQQNKNTVALIQNQLVAQSLEVDPFDEERLLFCFTNKVYDLAAGTFKPHFKFDYMLRNCGREWREPTAEQVGQINSLLESIQPNEDSRKALLSVQRTCLTGIRPELFIIFTGGGRNGKGVVVELMQFLLGGYSQSGHLTLLTKPMKSGPNTELRELHKKRSVVWSEPEEDAIEALRLSSIKMITGNENQNGRGLYNDNSATRIFATCILECNTPPAIMGDKGESARERICFVDFPMTFTNDPEKLAANPATYRPLDTRFKGTSFKEEHYCAYFKLLISTPLLSDLNIDEVYITEDSRFKAGVYLDNNDFMPAWVTENYTKLQMQERPRAFVSIKELYAGFKASDKFDHLSKAQKRSFNESKFRYAVAKSQAYKFRYRETQKVKVPGMFNGGYNGRDGIVDIFKNDDDFEPVDDASSSSGATRETLADTHMQAPKRHRVA